MRIITLIFLLAATFSYGQGKENDSIPLSGSFELKNGWQIMPYLYQAKMICSEANCQQCRPKAASDYVFGIIDNHGGTLIERSQLPDSFWLEIEKRYRIKPKKIKRKK